MPATDADIRARFAEVAQQLSGRADGQAPHFELDRNGLPSIRTWLNSDQWARLLDYRSGHAFCAWARRHAVPSLRRGKRLFFEYPDVIRALRVSHAPQRNRRVA